MVFNWDEFRNEKVAVWCDTEEKAKEFVEECFKRDISYFDRSKETDWYNYKENMCYCIIGSNLCYGSKSLFIGDGYKIIKWESGYTEFTFQEVIARIKEGEVYVNTNPSSRVEKLSLKYGKEVLIIEGNYKGLMHNEFGIILEDKFKLQEPIKIATIYKVEHKKDGKKYDFISSQRLEKEMFVVCDTSQGKSYGRIVDIETRELTEEEIKQYKECWRA